MGTPEIDDWKESGRATNPSASPTKMVTVEVEGCGVRNYGAISQSAVRPSRFPPFLRAALAASLAVLVLVAVVQHNAETSQMLFGNEVSKMEHVKMDPRSFVTKVSNGLSARQFMEKVSANFHSELAKSSILSVTKHLSKAGTALKRLSSLANETDAQLDKTANNLLKAQLDASDSKKHAATKPKGALKKKAVSKQAPVAKSKLATSKKNPTSVQVEPVTPVTKGGLAAAKKTSTLVHSISGKSDTELDREAETMMKKLLGKKNKKQPTLDKKPAVTAKKP